MSYGTRGQVRDMLDVPSTSTRDNDNIDRNRTIAYMAITTRIGKCDEDGPPTPYAILDPAAPATTDNFDRIMADGYRRLVVVMEGGGSFGTTPTLSITGVIAGASVTKVLAITEDGRYMTTEAFDSIAITGDPIVASADLITAGGTIEIFENVGELTDIENQWASGLFMMETSRELAKSSEPPPMHPWITDAMARLKVWLDENCTDDPDKSEEFRGSGIFRRGTSGDIYGDL